MKRAAPLAVFATLLLASAAIAQPAPPPPPPHHEPPATITISGEGMVSAAPDIAVLTSGVVTENKDAAAALKANSEAMQKVIATFRDAGVEERDIATSGFSVQPRYHYAQPGNNGQESPRITGYEVRNTVTVKVRDLAKLGGVLDAAVAGGSNQIDNLSLDVDKADELLDEARKSAVADARRKAELYAETAGVKLGRVVSISETTGTMPPPRPFAMRAQAAKADVPIAGGEQDLTVNVNMTWQIEQ